MIGECLAFITIVLLIILIGSEFIYFLVRELKNSLKDGNYVLVILIISVSLLVISGILMGLGI